MRWVDHADLRAWGRAWRRLRRGDRGVAMTSHGATVMVSAIVQGAREQSRAGANSLGK
jgi:hypothetical protein